MRLARAAIAAAALSLPALPARAAPRQGVSVPATTLDEALLAVARQAGVDIATTEPALRGVRTRSIAGAQGARAALDALLVGTGYRAVAVDARSFRIVRATAPPPPRRASPSRRSAPAPTRSGDVVVTASKQRLTLLRYPGSITVTAAQDPRWRTPGDLSDVTARAPVLQSTQLGPGRNKVFIRGVADSSFNGTGQSTASVYLDDVQLNFSGADPGLRLYDIAEVDVLEGPQGTLYGSGAIGGIIRLVSNPVDLHRWTGSVAVGATATVGGTPGTELSGVANLPVIAGRLGLRLVGYHIVDGGYIDDRERGLDDVNRTETRGGRGSALLDAGDGWRVELGGLAQRVAADDAQYAQTDVGPLARRSRIAQPYGVTVASGRLVLDKEWDSGLHLVSATGVVGTTSDDRFDASPTRPGSTIEAAYSLHGAKLLTSQETRLSRSLPGGDSWVLGFTLLRNRDALGRAFGRPGAETDIIGVTNVTRNASVFGEVTHPLTDQLSATLGARVTAARTDGEPSQAVRGADYVQGRSTRRVDPTAALNWVVAPGWAVFARYQSGYRTGGLAVARGIGRVADYRSDSIRVGELGVRRVRGGATGLAFSASASVATWSDIQADLVNRGGLPFTANIGDAQLQTLEATADWVPLPGLRLNAALFLTHNRVTGSVAALNSAANRRLPETPGVAAHAGASYEWRVAAATVLHVDAQAGYVGASVLGVGDALDVRQGNYVTSTLGIGVRRGRTDVSLTLDDPLNVRGDRFSYGDPFLLASRTQVTPLRPLNVGLRLSRAWE